MSKPPRDKFIVEKTKDGFVLWVKVGTYPTEVKARAALARMWSLADDLLLKGTDITLEDII
jgi:hypothetical protein